MSNYDINYDDKRFTQVESDKSEALSDLEQTYAGMIDQSDKYFEDQIQASKDWADKQSQLQQEQTDFAIEKIEQQKDQTKKDYLKEQSGAYVDWQKQSNEYGANAEKMASTGMTGTGFSESSQVSMYNTYQNRVAKARESYNNAVLNYNNAIKDARLQNNAALAQIAYEALQAQLELSLEGFQYKNQLILDKANKKTELENMYYNRYQDVLQQINTENALAEQIRQYNEQMAWEKEKWNATHSGSSGGGGGGGGGGTISGGSGTKSSNKVSKETISKNVKESAKKSIQGSEVNMQSVLDLGYGPISAQSLANKVNQGIVKETTNNGKITFKKVFNSTGFGK